MTQIAVTLWFAFDWPLAIHTPDVYNQAHFIQI
jgi:hypothetical protein